MSERIGSLNNNKIMPGHSMRAKVPCNKRVTILSPVERSTDVYFYYLKMTTCISFKLPTLNEGPYKLLTHNPSLSLLRSIFTILII